MNCEKLNVIDGHSHQFSRQLLSDLQILMQSGLIVVGTDTPALHGPVAIDIHDGKLCIDVAE